MKNSFFLILCFFFAGIVGCVKNSSIDTLDALPSQPAGIIEEEDMDFLFNDDFDDFIDLGDDGNYSDPFEPVNRFFFIFNDKLHYWVLKPVNSVYTAVIPRDIRISFGNLINNLASPIHLINNLLQVKLGDAGIVVARFVINSTLGVFGFSDPAFIEFGLEPKPEDFGQTLGVWGFGAGPYFCWPVLGPSNLRDTFGLAGDVYSHPMVYYVDSAAVSSSYYIGSRVNLLSLRPDVYEDLKKYSLDPYVSMRQVYLDYRKNKVEDKNGVQYNNGSVVE